MCGALTNFQFPLIKEVESFYLQPKNKLSFCKLVLISSFRYLYGHLTSIIESSPTKPSGDAPIIPVL
ncbi:Uncharacterized protein FWK35_00026233 [Aphis craccivora]|uniref:Uncharacterized protein n=1 Tax=Aphis craccivora TaxID=307492 RepID=A0A6G0Y0L3_APHCR|nr:Uncharacterized protein FWK35_00026233 [Aphis craccivora]